MKLRRHMTVALLMFVAPMSARASEPVPQLDPAVSFVTTGCKWSADGESGVVRVLIVNWGFEHVTSQVFVDWLSHSRDEGAEVFKSAAVRVINDPGVWSVGQPTIDPDRDSHCVVGLSATSPYGRESAEFLVKVGPPGELETKRVHQ